MAAEKTNSTAQSAIYNALKKNIMSLQLKPGTAMSTQEIAAKLNVSRTPVREAFIRLQRDGLVDIFPQKETIVSRIDFSKVEQERFIRESLECANLDLLVGKFTRQDLSVMEVNLEKQLAAMHANNQTEHIALDNEFHHYMFKITGQELAWQTIENTSNHYARIRLLSVSDDSVIHETILQHQKILSAAFDGDVEHAKIYMKAHLHRLEGQLQQILQTYPEYFDQKLIPDEERFSALLAEN
ncbi:MAG: GntR family transcriptional regulator [Treponema sp.]|nr:GntR family transcriptional regulator [Treponema sp.]